MAKMQNGQMVGAEGRIGKITYYRSNGNTVGREIVPVKNPKTDLQTLQRVISKQVGDNYKKFKAICDHSFEGVTNGMQCSAKFRSLNMKALRSRAAELQQAGQSLAQYYNFQPVGSIKWVPGRTILSQGQLTKIVTDVHSDGMGLYLGGVAVAENTYAGVCAALGAKRGDQLTFITVEKQNDEYIVMKSRVILDPRNADGSGAVMTSEFITGNAINLPNWKNDFQFSYLDYSGGKVSFAHGENGSTLVASAIIASRKDGNDWLRSNAELTVSEEACGSDKCSLWDAIGGSYSADSVDLESELYLNNAGVGGAQSGDSSSATPSTDPVFNNNVSINGASVNVSGGSVSVTAPLNSVVISGQRLADEDVVMVKRGASGTQFEAVMTATSATFSNIAGAAGDIFDVYKSEGGAVWFTINVQEAGGSGVPGGDE